MHLTGQKRETIKGGLQPTHNELQNITGQSLEAVKSGSKGSKGSMKQCSR